MNSMKNDKPEKNPMDRVLVVGFTNNLGGVESLIYTYYQNIDRSRLQFDFLVNVDHVPFRHEIEALSGRFFVIPQKTKDIIGYKRALHAFFEEHAKEYCAFWYNSNSLANLDYLIYAERYGIPKRIVHSHNTMETRGKLYQMFHAVNKKRAQKLATDYWACSPDAGRFFYDRNIMDSSKFKVINNAIDISKFQPAPQRRKQWRERLGLTDKMMVFGNVGRLSYQKNHIFLMQAFELVVNKNPNARLLLIGTGELEQEVREQVKQLHLENNVQFLGRQTDVAGIMQAMDAFVMPSHYEGLPISALEAQAAGLPCVFSDTITRDIQMSPNSTFVSISSPKQWCDAMLQAAGLEKTDNSEAIRKNGYDIREEAEKLMYYLQEEQS